MDYCTELLKTVPKSSNFDSVCVTIHTHSMYNGTVSIKSADKREYSYSWFYKPSKKHLNNVPVAYDVPTATARSFLHMTLFTVKCAPAFSPKE